MSSSVFNYFYRADINLVTFNTATGVSTLTVSVVNKPLKDATAVGTFWPILKSAGEIAFEAGELLPSTSVSTITLDNAIGTFGANRKFSDLLQRYTVTQQSLTLYIGQVANDVDTVTSWTQGPTVRIDSVEHAANGAEISLRVSPIRYDERVLTLEVSRSISGMEAAPDASLGKPVPLAFGTGNAIIPTRVSPDGVNYYIGAIATGLHNHLQNSLASAAFYTKNFVDEWEPVTNAKQAVHNTTGLGNAGVYTLNTYPEAITNVAIGGQVLVQGVSLTCKANGLAASTARLKVTLYRVDRTTKNVIEEVTSGQADLAVYNTQNNNVLNPDFGINISFDEVVYMSNYQVGGTQRYAYGVGISVTNWQAGDLSIRTVATVTDAWVRLTGDSSAGFTFRYTTLNALKLNLIELSPSYFNQYLVSGTTTGLNYSAVTLTASSFDSGQVAPVLDTFPVLVGNITGLGQGSLIPSQVAARLTYNWNGSSWVDSNAFNENAFSTHYAALFNGTSHRSRSVSGVIESRATIGQVLAEIARGSVSRIGVMPDGRQSLYPWGFTATPAAEIPAYDITPLSWEQRGIDTVVNEAVVSVNRNPLYSGRGLEDPTQIDGYQYTTVFTRNTSLYLTDMLFESQSLYGSRPMGDGQFNLWPPANGSGIGTYLGGSTAQGSVIAEYYFSRFGKPATYATFIVPWHRYLSLKMFDVVTFQHPEFPAFYGTDPEPALPAVDTGSAVQRTDPLLGYELTRSEPYRGLVEGLSYLLNMEHAPAIKLTVLVLLNQPWDPT